MKYDESDTDTQKEGNCTEQERERVELTWEGFTVVFESGCMQMCGAQIIFRPATTSKDGVARRVTTVELSWAISVQARLVRVAVQALGLGPPVG